MSARSERPKRILTWHIHGSYLYYLTQSPHQFYLPVKSGTEEGYGGKAGSFAWGENVVEVPAEQVKNLELDAILFQSRKNYLEDQYELLSDQQLKLPKLYLEHDPPREHPTDTRHIVDDPNILLVHVTHFNRLMWDAGRTPTCVIDHGVLVPKDARYLGNLDRGVVVVNNLLKRGRRLGEDIYRQVYAAIPLDLVGMNSKDVIGGIGEIGIDRLPYFEINYRFFFNPIRYTSLGLAVCEAMMMGMPIIGLATTEMVTTVENGVSGYVDTNVDRLIEKMSRMLADPKEAKRLSEGARRYAHSRFNIHRFANDWSTVFNQVIEGTGSPELA
ncbi:MAG TPA: glycosyltransferase [Anaerolineaceae bacterium]|nr:glycosyltransferase [Anaerolineaceae bacterium]